MSRTERTLTFREPTRPILPDED